jgi:hypothetical protein
VPACSTLALIIAMLFPIGAKGAIPQLPVSC